MNGFRHLSRLPGNPRSFRRHLAPRTNTNSNQTMCWDQLCAEGETCCHSMDLDMNYCCTQYSGFVLLGLMLGGGVTIALLIVICYLCMRKAERRLEEEAKLEALKTLSNTAAIARASSDSGNDTGGASAVSSSSTSSTASATPGEYYNRPPPAYEQVIAPDYLVNNPNHIRRCQSCDSHHNMLPSSVDYHDMPAMVTRCSSYRENHSNNSNNNCSGGNRNNENLVSSSSSDEMTPQAKYYNLPPLPPVLGSEDKLPTYSECVGHNLPPNTYVSHAQSDNSSNTLSQPISSRMTAMVDESSAVRGEYRRTSSLHRPVCIPTASQSPSLNVDTLASPVTIRLSTPTQVDDGTGIIVALQTGIRQASIENGGEPAVAPLEESSDASNQNHQKNQNEQVDSPEMSTPPYLNLSEDPINEESESTTMPGEQNLDSFEEEEDNQVNNSAMSMSISNDAEQEEEATSAHGGNTRMGTSSEDLELADEDGVENELDTEVITEKETVEHIDTNTRALSDATSDS